MSERDEKGMAYSFRFLKVSDVVAKHLVSDFALLGAREGDRFDQKGKVVSFSITAATNIEDIQNAILKYRVPPKQIDIVASLLTEADTDIIDIPDYVLNAVRAIEVQLTWSFTYVGN